MSSPEDKPEEQPESTTGTEAPDLPPIPSDGTSAPSDPDRVFGKPTAGSKGGSKAGGSNRGGSNHDDADAELDPAVPYDPRPDAPGGYGVDAERDLRMLRLRGRMALILGVGGLVFSVPLFPVGLGLSLLAIVLGITTLRRAGRVALPAPGAKAGIIVGIAAAVIAAIVGTIVYLFYDELSEWQECLSGANTRAGREICQVTFSDRAYDRIDELLDR